MISPSSLSAFTDSVSATRAPSQVQRVRDTAPASVAQRTQPTPTRTLPPTPPSQFTPRGSFLNLTV